VDIHARHIDRVAQWSQIPRQDQDGGCSLLDRHNDAIVPYLCTRKLEPDSYEAGRWMSCRGRTVKGSGYARILTRTGICAALGGDPLLLIARRRDPPPYALKLGPPDKLLNRGYERGENSRDSFWPVGRRIPQLHGVATELR